MTVTFPASLYCLMTEVHICEQLAHSLYTKVKNAWNRIHSIASMIWYQYTTDFTETCRMQHTIYRKYVNDVHHLLAGFTSPLRTEFNQVRTASKPGGNGASKR